MFKLNIYMKKILSTFKNTKGFTLIELLVVIGILGILAAALVATIDPFEQLKKATDSKLKNMAVEFNTANVRYFTTHNSFPWNDEDSSVTNCTDLGSADIEGATLADMEDCLGDANTGHTLIGEGELKSSFTSNENDLEDVIVFWDSTDANNIMVCFAPTSKSQKSSPETKWLATGKEDTVGDTCPDATAEDGTCYWCTQ